MGSLEERCFAPIRPQAQNGVEDGVDAISFALDLRFHR